MPLLFYMLVSLLYTASSSAVCLALSLPYDIVKCVLASLRRRIAVQTAGVTFYEGTIYHARQKPIHNAFKYSVRMALINLDSPPEWWSPSNSDFYSAQQARDLAGTTGPVRLLANPPTAGYTENPIAIYYCYSLEDKLQKCIAAVQNTPWGASVTFAFRPEGDSVPKALHVSPFMDMNSTWSLKTSCPGKSLSVSVHVSHPKLGNFFKASLQLERAALQSARSEEAGLLRLLRYGYQPQRAAILIYWQAVKLMCKGVPFYSPPDDSYREKVAATARNPKLASGEHFRWRRAATYPWNVDQ